MTPKTLRARTLTRIATLSVALAGLLSATGCTPSFHYTFTNNTGTTLTIATDTRGAPPDTSSVPIGTLPPHQTTTITTITFGGDTGDCTTVHFAAKDPSGQIIAAWPGLCEDRTYTIP